MSRRTQRIDDIADVAVAALTQPALHNRLFEVTGPRAITFAQAVKDISTAVGYPIHYQPVPIDAFIDFVAQLGEPEEVQWLMRELFTQVLDGRNSEPMSGVREALSRDATDFSDYIHKTLVKNIWQRAPETRTV